MTITQDSPFRSAARISRETFTAVLAAANSPWETRATELYDLAVSQRHDPAVWLAIAGRETTYGTNQDSVLWRSHTNSWTNARSVRDPALTDWTIITDPVRGSQYVKYRDVADSLRDGMYRITDPTYRYVQEGRVSIGAVIAIWDEGDAASYSAFVVEHVNTWMGQDKTMAGDDSRFTWAPDTSEFGYPQGQHGRNGKPIDYLIIHVTEGTDSAAWLRGGNGSSVHYLTHRDATPREQQLAEADAAWTAGSAEYNLRGINIEFERFAADAWTDAEVANAVATCAPIIARHNIPAVYLGRDNAGKRGIIGHMDVPDGNGGWGGSDHHTDPGEKFPWDKFVAGLQGGTPTPANGADPVTGKYIDTPFAAYFHEHGDVEVFGRPVTGSFIDSTTGLLTQFFERNVFELHPDGVKLRRLGAQAAAAAGFTGAGIP